MENNQAANSVRKNIKPSEVLEAAKKLIDSPEKWTKHVAARDSEGNPVDTYSDKAVCFCSLGAQRKALKDLGIRKDSDLDDLTFGFLLLATRSLTREPCRVAGFNDTRSHALVMRMWDLAIEFAKQREASGA